MGKKVEGVYRLEALGPQGAVEIMDVDLDMLLELENLVVFRLPADAGWEHSINEMEEAISAIQSISGDKKWLVISHDVELLRVVKVA
jgi:hypothetical protein